MVLTTFSGTVTGEDFVSLYRELYADPDYAPGVDELADLIRVAKFDVRGEELREVREFMLRRYRTAPGATFRTAIVASADANFGIGRMYEAIASETPENVHVFRNPEKAVQWLRLDTPGLLSLLAAD